MSLADGFVTICSPDDSQSVESMCASKGSLHAYRRTVLVACHTKSLSRNKVFYKEEGRKEGKKLMNFVFSTAISFKV